VADAEVVVGRVTRAHGLRGQLVIQPASPGSDVLLRVDVVTSVQAGTRRELRIRDSRYQGKLLLLSFEGVPDRTAAERLIGAELFVLRSALPPPDEDEFYTESLIGLGVQDPAGRQLGKVVDLESAEGLTWLVVETSTGRHLLPFTVPLVKVDIEKGCLIVDAPVGLLDGAET
jgi:16S rRNA processing protein RimM